MHGETDVRIKLRSFLTGLTPVRNSRGGKDTLEKREISRNARGNRRPDKTPEFSNGVDPIHPSGIITRTACCVCLCLRKQGIVLRFVCTTHHARCNNEGICMQTPLEIV